MMTGNDRYALLTGATKGIGLELAKLLAKDGYNLVIVDSSQEGLSNTANELADLYRVKVVTITKALSGRNVAFEIYEEIKLAGIRVEILVNNAGEDGYKESANTDVQRELDIVQLNITGLVTFTRLFLNDMVSRRAGKILNVVFVEGMVPASLRAIHHGTKAFVHSFTEVLREELKDSGVTVTSLLPGATATDFFNKAKMLQAKHITDKKLASAAGLAQGGYEALMNGEDMFISGFLNKLQCGVGTIFPGEKVASNVTEQQTPSYMNDES
jgi:short-subunit dehydrogenase